MYVRPFLITNKPSGMNIGFVLRYLRSCSQFKGSSSKWMSLTHDLLTCTFISFYYNLFTAYITSFKRFCDSFLIF